MNNRHLDVDRDIPLPFGLFHRAQDFGLLPHDAACVVKVPGRSGLAATRHHERDSHGREYEFLHLPTALMFFTSLADFKPGVNHQIPLFKERGVSLLAC